uniref:Acetylcholinesterase n=1 Tax=Parastrongyloides trichosuri TaxID=131310 RepID=A0A0N4ZVX0_PARTI
MYISLKHFKKINGTTIRQYLGIPFARPPVNQSRFGKPQTYKPKKNIILNATTPARPCMQALEPRGFESRYFNESRMNQSEDCLQLNMWVPNKISSKNKQKSGVLVFIFGDGFRFGSPSLDLYNGSILAAKTGLIVVNLNYRLGIFGFAYMSYGTNVTGNMGLLDQQMGLKWVYENIEKFGGDRNNITLWGQGYGAISAAAHLYSVGSEKYFKKIILMSGSANSMLGMQLNTVVDTKTRQVAQSLGCNNYLGHKNNFECMLKKSAENITKHAENYSAHIYMPSTVGFSIIPNDTVFFKGSFYNKYLKGKIKRDVDVLLGLPIKDGAFFLPTLKEASRFGCKYDKMFEYNQTTCKMNYTTLLDFLNVTRLALQLNDTSYDYIKQHYSHPNATGSFKLNATKFLTDMCFRCHLIDFAKNLDNHIARKRVIYTYLFNMSSYDNHWPDWMVSTHGDELPYAFGLPFRRPDLYNNNETIINEEKALSLKIMKMIKKFTEKSGFYENWPQFDDVKRKGILIDRDFKPDKNVTIINDMETFKCKRLLPLLPKHLAEYTKIIG